MSPARRITRRARRPLSLGVQTRYAAGARVLDLCAVIVLLPATVMLGAVVALVVAIDSPGPVLFRSRRVGRDGKHFDVLKFRTMRHLAAGPSISSKGDERQTPVGRFLATSRLDELPQLWNVLKGQMRLVGPRPELEEFVREQWEGYERILTVPPGLTGSTQLLYADEGRALAAAADRISTYRSEILPRKVLLDLEYLENRSLSGDIAIIARTCLVPLVRLRTSINAATEATDRAGRLAAARVLAAGAAVAVLLAVFAASAGSL